jgi:hypothetical protein
MAGENVQGPAQFLTNRAGHERAMAAIRRKYRMFPPIIELGGVLASHRPDARQDGIVRGLVGWLEG